MAAVQDVLVVVVLLVRLNLSVCAGNSFSFFREK
jgi:hypothetical protein